MPKTWVYLLLAFVGAILPMTQFLPWFLAHGLDLPLFGRELFVNRISRFFAIDLLLTAVSVILLAASERRVRFWWLPVLVTGLVGVSAGLPLLMFLRARNAEREKGSSA